jgi:hypothetical protein
MTPRILNVTDSHCVAMLGPIIISEDDLRIKFLIFRCIQLCKSLYIIFIIVLTGIIILKTEINGRGDPLRRPRNTLYPQKLALTSPTSGSRSVGMVRLRTKSHGVQFIIIMALQPFVGPWTLFQFVDPIHSR